MKTKPETRKDVADLVSEAQHRFPSAFSEWNATQSASDVLIIHVLINRSLLLMVLPEQIMPAGFDGNYFFTIRFMKVDKTTFRNVPSMISLPSYTEMRISTYIDVDGSPGYFDFETWIDGNAFTKAMELFTNENLRKGKISQNHNYYSLHEGKEGISVRLPYSVGHSARTAFDQWLAERYFSMHLHKGIVFRQDVYHFQPALFNADIVDPEIVLKPGWPDSHLNHPFHAVYAPSRDILYAEPIPVSL